VLLRRDNVTWHGEYYEAVEARNVPGCVQRPRLPFVVAANAPDAMEVAARYGAGWITTGTPGVESLDAWWDSVATISARFAAPGVRRILQTDAAPVYSLSSVNCFLDFTGRAGELGFTDVAVPWPRSAGPFAGRESIVDEIAAARSTATP
jgi:alkanesulfonate monooxygenase SsuD/methylene tetrahydromethanopterin reductase-like flavin-dependent oxidoreductase (luciferase family)